MRKPPEERKTTGEMRPLTGHGTLDIDYFSRKCLFGNLPPTVTIQRLEVVPLQAKKVLAGCQLRCQCGSAVSAQDLNVLV